MASSMWSNHTMHPEEQQFNTTSFPSSHSWELNRQFQWVGSPHPIGCLMNRSHGRIWGCVFYVSHISKSDFVQTLRQWCSVACQAPLSMGFSRQEYWSRLPCPSPGDLPDPGIKPLSLTSFTLPGRCFTTGATWEAPTLQAEQANSYRDWVPVLVRMNYLPQQGRKGSFINSGPQPFWHLGMSSWKIIFPQLGGRGDDSRMIQVHYICWAFCFCSVTKSCLTLCDPMDCSMPGSSVLHSPRVCSNSCPLSWWCYLTISSFATPFSFCLHSFPTSESFPMSQIFASGVTLFLI